jgi:hypothetical protein
MMIIMVMVEEKFENDMWKSSHGRSDDSQTTNNDVTSCHIGSLKKVVLVGLDSSLKVRRAKIFSVSVREENNKNRTGLWGFSR